MPVDAVMSITVEVTQHGIEPVAGVLLKPISQHGHCGVPLGRGNKEQSRIGCRHIVTSYGVRHFCQHWLRQWQWRLTGAKPLPEPMLTYWQLDHWKRSSAKLAPNTDENQFENNESKNVVQPWKLTWVSTLLIILTTNKLISHWKGDTFVVFKPHNISLNKHFDSGSHWDAITIFQCESFIFCAISTKERIISWSKLKFLCTYCYQSLNTVLLYLQHIWIFH